MFPLRRARKKTGVSGVGSDFGFASSLLQGLPSPGLGFLMGKMRVTLRTSKCNSSGRAGHPQVLGKAEGVRVLTESAAHEPTLVSRPSTALFISCAWIYESVKDPAVFRGAAG